jgi:c-di-GMP-related signal transduction protein
MVFVPEPIKEALLENKGPLYEVLNFVMEYEFGHWMEISRQALMRNIAIDTIYDAYLDSQLWYSNLISMPEQEGEL